MIGELTEDWESRDREESSKEGKSTRERGLITKAERDEEEQKAKR